MVNIFVGFTKIPLPVEFLAAVHLKKCKYCLCSSCFLIFWYHQNIKQEIDQEREEELHHQVYECVE